MFQLYGTHQRYAWGTIEAIPHLLGTEPDGAPFAELWLGAHSQAPSLLAGDTTLLQKLHDEPGLLGPASRQAFGDQLPFLMKVLSARHALSIQAHPNRELAEAGYARENSAGVALDSPHRVYSDDWPKPEILVALEPFDTLAGFRDPVTSAALFSGLGLGDSLQSVIGPLTERKGAAALAEVFLDVLTLEGDRAHLLDLVSAAAVQHAEETGAVGDFARTALELDEVFPGDRGILAALLMNRVRLQPGEAVYVPAGVMHAHLRGTGIEVMANSDNVIRGGLTPKHVDVGELVRVVGFEPGDPWIVRPTTVAPGVEHYLTDCPEFDLWRVRPVPGGTELPGHGSARVILVVGGELILEGPEPLRLQRGASGFVGADEVVRVTGSGEAFVSGSGTR